MQGMRPNQREECSNLGVCVLVGKWAGMIALHTVKSRDDVSKGPCTNTLSKCKTGDRETAVIPEGSKRSASCWGSITGIVFPEAALSDCPMEFPGEVCLMEIK